MRLHSEFKVAAGIGLVLGVFGVIGCEDPRPSTGDTAALLASDVEPSSCAAPSGHDFHCLSYVHKTALLEPHADATATTWVPADLQKAYALDSSRQSNATIAIVDAYAYPNAEADLTYYRQYFALPACTSASGCLRIVNQKGQTSPAPPTAPINNDWTGEAALDLDMASVACPSCKLLLVLVDSNDFPDLPDGVATAAQLGATVISNSWGSEEVGSSSYTSLLPLSGPATIFAASGDTAYEDGSKHNDAGAEINYRSWPAVLSQVVAVGGTSLTAAPGSARGYSESAWSASGSTCSTTVAKPSFQSDTYTGCGMRASTDVSSVADPNTAVYVYHNGAWAGYGGTSASSPFVAGVYALYGLGSAGSSFAYSNAALWNDVTSGNNGSCGAPLCASGKGWDGPTGFGTPNGALIAQRPPAPTACGQLLLGQGLVGGGALLSCDGRFRLTLQLDGNLVLYEGDKALWASNSNNFSPFDATLQTDCNLVLYDAGKAAHWASNSSGHSGCTLAVQNDGDVVIYDGNHAIVWQTNTMALPVPTDLATMTEPVDLGSIGNAGGGGSIGNAGGGGSIGNAGGGGSVGNAGGGGSVGNAGGGGSVGNAGDAGVTSSGPDAHGGCSVGGDHESAGSASFALVLLAAFALRRRKAWSQ
jgi:MYXO-CTERM domain-containing protein